MNLDKAGHGASDLQLHTYTSGKSLKNYIEVQKRRVGGGGGGGVGPACSPGAVGGQDKGVRQSAGGGTRARSGTRDPVQG